MEGVARPPARDVVRQGVQEGFDVLASQIAGDVEFGIDAREVLPRRPAVSDPCTKSG